MGWAASPSRATPLSRQTDSRGEIEQWPPAPRAPADQLSRRRGPQRQSFLDKGRIARLAPQGVGRATLPPILEDGDDIDETALAQRVMDQMGAAVEPQLRLWRARDVRHVLRRHQRPPGGLLCVDGARVATWKCRPQAGAQAVGRDQPVRVDGARAALLLDKSNQLCVRLGDGGDARAHAHVDRPVGARGLHQKRQKIGAMHNKMRRLPSRPGGGAKRQGGDGFTIARTADAQALRFGGDGLQCGAQAEFVQVARRIGR